MNDDVRKKGTTCVPPMERQIRNANAVHIQQNASTQHRQGIAAAQCSLLGPRPPPRRLLDRLLST